MDQKQDGNWYQLTTFVFRQPNASRFGISIAGGENSSMYISRIDSQNDYPGLRRLDIILSINDIDLTETDPNAHDLAVHLFRSTPQDAAIQLRVRRFLPMKLVEYVSIKLLPYDKQLGISVSTDIDGQGFRISSIVPGGAAYRTHRLIKGDHILEVHYSAGDKKKVDLRWINHDKGVKAIRRAYKNKEITLMVKHQYSVAEAT
jgi:hypothetical protein